MKRFDLYQILLSNEEIDTINEMGWGEETNKVVPKAGVMLRNGLNGSKKFESSDKRYYTLTANTTCDNLDKVFDTFNNRGEHFVKLSELMRSASAGDLIHNVDDDKWYMIDMFGFGEVEV